MHFKVIEIVGEFAMSSASGQQLYDVVFPLLQSGAIVELDFVGVNVVASAFFNVAIGQLLQDFDAETLNQRLKLENLQPHVETVLRHVLKNSKRYYSDRKYQEAVDATMAEYAASL